MAIWISVCLRLYSTKLAPMLTFRWWIGENYPVHQICMQEPHCQKCLQLPSIGSDISFVWGRGNVSVLNTFLKGVCPGLEQCIWWCWCNSCWSHRRCAVCLAVCWLASTAELRIGTNYTYVKGGKLIRIMALPPTSQNLLMHILQAIMLQSSWKQQPSEGCLHWICIRLDMKGGILVLAISHAPVGPDALTDAITCGCVAQGNACITQYSFYYDHITSMMVCNPA